MDKFKAFRIRDEDGTISACIEMLSLAELTPGEIIIEAAFSSINYKDALAATGQGKILRQSPLNGGIDVAGVVVDSNHSHFREGDEVLVTGCGLGEIYDGGYAEYVRVKSECVTMLPKGLSLFEAMVIGTPGFTAALALHRMEENRQRPNKGPIIVSGASGGVGNLAVDIFASRGYEVVAVTSKEEQVDKLKQLGANRVLMRDEIDPNHRPLESARWGGAVDTVGGDTLSWLSATTREWGNIASIGLTAGHEFSGSVMPFILRGVSLLGISSTNCPCALRHRIWNRLGHELKPQHLSKIHYKTVGLGDLMGHFEDMLDRKTEGRTVVSIKEDKS